LKLIAMSGNQTLDMDKKYSGGRPFDLGPGGVIFSRNLTPDKETGLGNWTDQEIEVAIRYGARSDGSRLHPLMPYRNFVNLAADDMKAIIAYLRSLPAVKHDIPRRKENGEQYPPVQAPANGIPETGPARTDKVAWGEYLVRNLLSCSDCHTPIDAKTGAPVMEKAFAGGQPYEGPWGIVYSSNITSDKKTGVGDWSDDQLKVAFQQGIDRNGRRLIVMPWEDYANLTADDAQAVVTFLKSKMPAITNEVPAASIRDPFKEVVASASSSTASNAATSAGSPNLILIVGGIVVVLAVLGGAVMMMRRGKSA
jgi:mono/diheme cytochrome c family protein